VLQILCNSGEGYLDHWRRNHIESRHTSSFCLVGNCYADFLGVNVFRITERKHDLSPDAQVNGHLFAGGLGRHESASHEFLEVGVRQRIKRLFQVVAGQAANHLGHGLGARCRCSGQARQGDGRFGWRSVRRWVLLLLLVAQAQATDGQHRLVGVCGKVGKVVREEPKVEVPAAPIAMVAPGLDITAIVTAAIAAGKSQKELLELIAALKA
jgi:hypothetical protein